MDCGDFGFWLLGFWGFWILDFGDVGDFGFWLLGFWGFWILGILGILGFWGGPGDVPLGNLVTVPGGQRLESTLVCLWGPLQNQLYLIEFGARKQIEHFFRGQSPTKSQKNPDFQPRGQDFTQSQKNLEFQPTSKQI